MSGTKTAESEENGQNAEEVPGKVVCPALEQQRTAENGQNAEEVPEMESSPALLQQNRLNV